MSNVTTLKLGGSSNVATGNIKGGMDFYSHEIDVAAAVAAGFATTDYIEVVTAPADSFLELKQIEITKDVVLGATSRIDIGDSGDMDRFVTNATTYTAGTVFTLAVSERGYNSADSLRLKLTGAGVATGKIRFIFGLMDTSLIPLGVSPDL